MKGRFLVAIRPMPRMIHMRTLMAMIELLEFRMLLMLQAPQRRAASFI